MTPSLSGRKPGTAALAAAVVVALVGGGALASAAVGTGSNTDTLRNVGPPGNGTGTATSAPTATTTPTATSTPASDSSEPLPVTDTSTESDPAVTDTDTQTDTETSTDGPSAAENEPPEAAFVAESLPLRAGDEAAFFASQSEDPDGEIVSHEWDFGDGGTATGQNVTHTYEDVDQYEITLTVTDDESATDTVTQRYTAAEPRERPDPVICHPHDGFMVGEEIQFDGRSIVDGEQRNDDIVRWEWDFGTGTVGDTTYNAGNATGQEVTHTYDNWGSYTITLTVTTNDMVTESASIEVYVGNQRDSYCPPGQRED